MGIAEDLLAKSRANTVPEQAPDKFYSVLPGGGAQEEFLELQFKNGLALCFSYKELFWFHYSPKYKEIEMEFGGFLVTIKGKGLYPKLFRDIKARRVSWIKEADSEMQEHDGNELFIESIEFIAPEGFFSEPPVAND